MSALKIQLAAKALYRGDIIAYPTEGVWGLGCDPENLDAVLTLLSLKQRPITKGLILVAATIEQFAPYLTQLTQQQYTRLQESWPGPRTWLLPNNQYAPDWISGGQANIALRVSAHPIVAQLCKKHGGPIVSTSANVSGKHPALTMLDIQLQFSARTATRVTVVPGSLGDSKKPTTIQDLLTGKIIRA